MIYYFSGRSVNILVIRVNYSNTRIWTTIINRYRVTLPSDSGTYSYMHNNNKFNFIKIYEHK